MDFKNINELRWKRLLELNDRQSCAIEKSIQLAESNADISKLLKADLEQLEKGIGRMTSSEEEWLRLYGEELFRMHPVLVLLLRLPWLLQKYSEHGIDEKVLKDTLSDVRIWMNVCERKTGYQGLLEYGWLSNHFSFKLFRIGRLQFIAQPGTVPAFVYRHKESGLITALCPDGASYHQNGDGEGTNGRSSDDVWTASLKENNGTISGYPIHRRGYAIRDLVRLDSSQWELAYQPGDLVLDMHIAEGCPLAPEEVRMSIETAPDFFEWHMGIKSVKALTCSSWLLDDNIAQMCPNGNIAAFQRFFQLVPHKDSSDWQTRQRVFGNPDIDILKAECKSSLQKSIRAWYETGRSCRHAAGVIIL